MLDMRTIVLFLKFRFEEEHLNSIDNGFGIAFIRACVLQIVANADLTFVGASEG